MLCYSGYMSPEYMMNGLFSVKSNVFSFGILVLEIVSGKRNRGFFHPYHHLNLLGHWVSIEVGLGPRLGLGLSFSLGLDWPRLVYLLVLDLVLGMGYVLCWTGLVLCICFRLGVDRVVIQYPESATIIKFAEAIQKVLYKEDGSMELIDEAARDKCCLSEALRSIHVGLLCVQQHPKDRLTMSSVVLMLVNEDALPFPKQPGFFTERNLTEAISSSSKTAPSSVNDYTITIIDS
ncbi:hypothetical protein TEA_000897 [Camellia sinensis var. sinensis]|uniref:Serine-threonine/tyrosine-protein kinase catalytic domain-containing protein n=1 Tax=Camellia sinensis var. sinensis TaxID=542762 RepID=A0A4S4ERD5_CAMSN|nr:hypothetical protein TEA_000897 [Camellia sinensis var. sinensis]